MAQTEADYLEGRLKDQLDYHSTQSKKNKKRFYALQFVIIITSALVPIVNVINPEGAGVELRLTSSILGGIIVVITAVMQLHKYQENWILFRTTQELLKKEKFLYLNDAGDYAGLDSEKKKRLLVERVESLVSAETSRYFAIHKPEQGKPGGDSGSGVGTTTTTTTPSQ
jgi:Protein of unknown function (DUF4231)